MMMKAIDVYIARSRGKKRDAPAAVQHAGCSVGDPANQSDGNQKRNRDSLIDTVTVTMSVKSTGNGEILMSGGKPCNGAVKRRARRAEAMIILGINPLVRVTGYGVIRQGTTSSIRDDACVWCLMIVVRFRSLAMAGALNCTQFQPD